MATEFAEPAGRAGQASDDDLLRRHRPRLHFDSQGDFKPIAVESIAEGAGNALLAEGRTVAKARPAAGTPLSVEVLADGIPGIEFDDSARLQQGESPFAVARRLQRDRDFAGRVYGRVVRQADRIYLQYWLWFYYRQGHLLGYERHEGDWKLIQVVLDSEEKCLAVVCERRNGQTIEGDLTRMGWDECEPECTPSCRHPRIYVDPFSNATYFERGTYFSTGGTDSPDGRFEAELPSVEPLGEWASWPGRWGATSEGNGFGQSPRSPALEPGRWDPRKFEKKADKRWPLADRPLQGLVSWARPEPPRIDTAARHGDTVVVEWHVRGRPRPTWILFTVHERANPSEVLRKRVVRTLGSSGKTRIVLASADPVELTLRATAFNALRLRSEPAPDYEVGIAEDQDVRDDWSRRVWMRLQRELLRQLTTSGAATIEELEQRPIHVLELPLDRKEITAVVESTRRAGLVEPLGQDRRADGTSVDDPEWVPTEDGRRRSLPFMRWWFRGVALAPPAILIALSKDAIWPWLKKLSDLEKVMFAIILVTLAAGLGLFLYRRLGGASDRELARQWSRHATELNLLNLLHAGTAKRRLLAFAVSLAAYVGGAFLDAAVQNEEGSWARVLEFLGDAISLLGLVGVIATYIAAVYRVGERRTTAGEARTRREAAGFRSEKSALDAMLDFKRPRIRLGKR